jgi:hypothetical protein
MGRDVFLGWFFLDCRKFKDHVVCVLRTWAELCIFCHRAELFGCLRSTLLAFLRRETRK